MPLLGGIGQPVDGKMLIARHALPVQIHLRQIALRFRITQVARRMPQQTCRTALVDPDGAARNAGPVIVAKRYKGMRHAACPGMMRTHIRMIINDAMIKFEGFCIAEGDAFARAIHTCKFQLGIENTEFRCNFQRSHAFGQLLGGGKSLCVDMFCRGNAHLLTCPDYSTGQKERGHRGQT